MTTPQDGASSVQACAIRAARLSATGTTPAGANNLYANKRFVKVTTSPVYETGEELTLKTACGVLDVAMKSRDLLKRWNMDIEFTYPDPEALELLTGGAVLTDGGGSTIGYQVPKLLTVPNPNGASIEVWEKAVLVDSQTTPGYFRHAYPRVYLQMGNRGFENKPNTTLLSGYATENPNWGNGPNNDFTDDGTTGGGAVDTTAIWQWIRDNNLPSIMAAGYQATPTQV